MHLTKMCRQLEINWCRSRIMKALSKTLLAALALAMLAIHHARAGLFIDIVESGSDVVATLSGSIDDLYGTTLASSGTYLNSNKIGGNPSRFYFTNNPGSSEVYDVYNIGSFPANFSSASSYSASSSTATASIFISASSPSIFISRNYTLGTAITGQLTWNSTTVGGLGLENGFYFWDWSGDSISMSINGTGPAPVPEPDQVASMLLLAGGFGVYFLAKRRVQTASASVNARRPARRE